MSEEKTDKVKLDYLRQRRQTALAAEGGSQQQGQR